MSDEGPDFEFEDDDDNSRRRWSVSVDDDGEICLTAWYEGTPYTLQLDPDEARWIARTLHAMAVSDESF